MWDPAPAPNDAEWQESCAKAEAAQYPDMPKGFIKVKKMVDALLEDPMSTFATSATCTIHNKPCPIPRAEEALQCICRDTNKKMADDAFTKKEKTAVRKSM